MRPSHPTQNLRSQKSPSDEGLLAQHNPASSHLNDGLHDGALGGDGLGVRLVVALRLDQVDQFVGQIDVGLFQGVRNDGTQSPGFRCIVTRNARCVGFFQLVIFRSLLITEVGGVVGGVTGVLTEVSLPVESNDMVEATGAVTVGSLPSGLRPSISV